MSETKPICAVTWLGTMPYDEAWALQEAWAREIAAGKRKPTLILLEHPHIYTLGRRGKAENLLWSESERAERGVQTRWVDRGGDITYHGPGQLVGYPLLPLAQADWQGEKLPQTDYVGYIRKLEKTIILTLAGFGIVSAQREGLTGVWVSEGVMAKCRACPPDQKPQPAKIASIGVKVDAKGVSRHGFALNVDMEMEYWNGIIPCGLDGVQMTSVAQLIDPCPSMEQVRDALVRAFAEVFDLEMVKDRSKTN